jgi:uncharacterized membrane protein YbhN (UPF0104 family)
MKKRAWPNWLVQSIKLTISVGLIALLARKVPIDEAYAAVKKVGIGFWLQIILLQTVALLLAAFRWYLAAQRSISWPVCVRFTWIGQFYAYVLPGAIVADVAKVMVLAAKHAHLRTVSLPVSVFLDRLLGLVGLLLISMLSLIVCFWNHPYHMPASEWQVLLGGAAVVVSVGTATAPLWMARLAHVTGARRTTRLLVPRFVEKHVVLLRQTGAGNWATLLAVSMVIHFISAYTFALAAAEVGVSAGLGQMIVYYAVTSFAVLLPITIAGVGLREQVSIWLLGSSSTSVAMPVALSWVILAAGVFHGLVGAAVHIGSILKKRRTPQSEGLTEADTP